MSARLSQSLRRWSMGAALAGALAATLLFLPARWLAGPVASMTRSHVQLVNASGTLWNGRADVVLSGGEDSRTRASLPGGISWRLRPGLSPLASLSLTASCCTAEPLQLEFRLGWGLRELRWKAGSLRWPTELLAGLGTPWNTLGLEGRMDIETPGLSVALARGRLVVDGQVTVRAQDLSSRMATLRPLGSYQIDVRSGEDGGATAIVLSTLRGDLQIQGTGQWVGGRLRFRGEAWASPNREAALANLLNIIGRRQGSRSIINLG